MSNRVDILAQIVYKEVQEFVHEQSKEERMGRVIKVDEKRSTVSILINNVLVTFAGEWVGERLKMRVLPKEKPGVQVHDPAQLDVPGVSFAAASRQAAQILTERRERASRKSKQLTIPGV